MVWSTCQSSGRFISLSRPLASPVLCDKKPVGFVPLVVAPPSSVVEVLVTLLTVQQLDPTHLDPPDLVVRALLWSVKACAQRLIDRSLFVRVHSATFTFTNNCPYTVWPGTLTGGGGAQLSSTGFELATKASSTLNVPAPWSGRFWGRTQCGETAGKFQCTTADCGSGQITCNGAGGIPPASLIELTLAANGGQDFYDVSLVDGLTCLFRSPHKVKGSDGSVVACKSACLAFNQPQYCCTGAYSSPDKCVPTMYSKFFKGQCPLAYSYAFDDKSSTFTCSGGANYLITFCP
ncbi:Thaumatin-like protein 1 [Hibiscus syriacus]|uniref:Thaumatin-like protein 1 n=1 Tax=Hibiscus syriacus TaxID=106335 RepID=A0A6A3BQ03_HIBSY|nr:Thaumatin-like protein 1 [Hibiscus syriacus]